MLANLVAEATARWHAEPGDLCLATWIMSPLLCVGVTVTRSAGRMFMHLAHFVQSRDLPLTGRTILRPWMAWDQSGWLGRASDATPLAR